VYLHTPRELLHAKEINDVIRGILGLWVKPCWQRRRIKEEKNISKRANSG
jgi:hypothetical protein